MQGTIHYTWFLEFSTYKSRTEPQIVRDKVREKEGIFFLTLKA